MRVRGVEVLRWSSVSPNTPPANLLEEGEALHNPLENSPWALLTCDTPPPPTPFTFLLRKQAGQLQQLLALDLDFLPASLRHTSAVKAS